MIRLWIFILLALTKPVCAQHVAGKVYYRQILNLDPATSSNDKTGRRAILYFTDTLSYYVYNSVETGKADKPHENNEAANTYDIGTTDRTGEVFMTNFNTRHVFMREFVWKKPYLSIDTLVRINWKLIDRQKRIGKFTCQQAEALFRGRKYEVWFTTEVPVSAGPWKLQGLPGLILEAYDDKNEVHYLFDGIEIPDIKIFTLKIPSDGIMVPLATYRNLWKDETAKLKTFLEATAEKGTSIDVGINYFPIEKTYE